MKYGQSLTIHEKWKIDSDIVTGKLKSDLPLRHKATGDEIDTGLRYLAEDFFHLSADGLSGIPEEHFIALKKLDGILMWLPPKALEALCSDGFGESIEEMYSNTMALCGVKMMIPKLIRDYAVSKFGDWAGDMLPLFGDYEYLCACVEKYGKNVNSENRELHIPPPLIGKSPPKPWKSNNG